MLWTSTSSSANVDVLHNFSFPPPLPFPLLQNWNRSSTKMVCKFTKIKTSYKKLSQYYILKTFKTLKKYEYV